MTFNRERFLLRLIAGVVVAELAFYGVGTAACAWRFASSSVSSPICRPLREGLNGAVETALNVLLALLGAGAVAAGAISDKRRDDPPPPEENDPRY